MNNEIPTLIKRCLAHGVQICPALLATILRSYDKYRMPDDALSTLSEADLKEYVDGLYLSAQEMAGDWSRGHAKLKALGFTENRIEEGHRTFVSLSYI